MTCADVNVLQLNGMIKKFPRNIYAIIKFVETHETKSSDFFQQTSKLIANQPLKHDVELSPCAEIKQLQIQCKPQGDWRWSTSGWRFKSKDLIRILCLNFPHNTLMSWFEAQWSRNIACVVKQIRQFQLDQTGPGFRSRFLLLLY